ncbi:hypothetical protein SAMN05216207_1004101 [Pseudonocardia ammonioxydans]|uniref:Uncharacterized protein n=1 Tax=Pseudonocardia ammonioxydans TaxID=260086 RepID=A0A1I4UHD2_PSUAM|nr:hypothetical protein [Pseudonocardia ammonioxydans]SFM88417.1 hypothetical protein SAMN05216207_1004101 [Pseudonocardia ammonioxydans]
MTTYAHDATTSIIVATWPTGDGAAAQKIARVPRNWSAEHARRTAGILTRLSAHLWHAYSEQTVEEIRPFRLVEAVRYPKRPVGSLIESMEDDGVEAAHQLGRIVSLAPGRAFRDAVVREVRAEIDAVLDADVGVLDGRAQQTVAHVRPDASETHLLTAHSLLRADPLNPWGLLTSIEPNAAATAALRWLRAAGELVSTLVGHPVADVVALAEAIGHEDLQVTRNVLDRGPGQPDDELVRHLLQEAVLAGRGYFLLCPDGREPADPGGAGAGGEHRHRVVTTVLDPAEPGRCLVDGLIRGIQGCFRVYADETTTRERPDVDPQRTGPEWMTELRTRFSDELRHAVRTDGSTAGAS